MARYYSPSEGGFFDPDLGDVPPDAQEVDQATYDQLLADQQAGKVITADANGDPIATAPAPMPLADQRALMTSRIMSEANRRMDALGSLRDEVNDIRRLLVAGGAPTQAQTDRFAALDAIETARADLVADMLVAADPLAFPYTDDALWSPA